MIRSSVGIIVGLLLTLSACGGGGSTTPGSISGTVDPLVVTPKGFEHPRPNMVPGEVIVRFKPTPAGLRAQGLSSLSVNGQRLEQVRPLFLERTRLYRAGNLSEPATRALAAAIAARDDVQWATPNGIDYPQATEPTDPFYKLQWHYGAMNLPNAWDISTGTDGMVVAVLDTGILWDGDSSPNSHPDLEGQVLPGFDFVSNPSSGGDGDGRDNNPFDPGPNEKTSYHGTHVAGTIAAATNNGIGVAGVNPKAKILPVRVLGLAGGNLADITDGVLWAAGLAPKNGEVTGIPANPNPAKVINMSLGSVNPCVEPYPDAFAAVKTVGAIVVVAAGNENVDASTTRPAGCENVIVVGATDLNGKRAPYSNYGTKVDIMAPGGDTSATFTATDGTNYTAGVLSTAKDDNTNELNYPFYQGTSMATPHVAGLVSLMAGLKPDLSFDQARSILRSASNPLSATLCDRPTANECGAGSVDAAKALSSNVIDPTPPPPPPPAPPPPPSKKAKTFVVACLLIQTAQGPDCDAQKSRYVEFAASSSAQPYRIPDLAPDTYAVIALTDLNGNNDFDSGEPAGITPNVRVEAGKETANITVKLQPVQLQGGPGTLMPSSLRLATERFLRR